MNKFINFIVSIIICILSLSCGNSSSTQTSQESQKQTNHEYFQANGWHFVGVYRPYILVDDRVGKSQYGASYYVYKQGMPNQEWYGILEDSWAKATRTPKVYMQDLILGDYRFKEYKEGEMIGYRNFNAHFGLSLIHI